METEIGCLHDNKKRDAMNDRERVLFIELIADLLIRGRETVHIGDLENFFPEEIEEARELAEMEI
jgi:hypothetical protein